MKDKITETLLVLACVTIIGMGSVYIIEKIPDINAKLTSLVK